MNDFKESVRNVSKQIIFWSLPATFLFIVLRAQIVRVILGTGSFSWEDTRLVAASLAIFSVSIVAQSLTALFARVYYSVGNTRKPLYVNVFSSGVIVVSSFVLLKIFHTVPLMQYFVEHLLKVEGIVGTDILMLPLAYSFGTMVNMLVLWYFVKRDFMHHEQFISRTFFESLSGSFFIGFVSFVGLNLFASVFDTSTFAGILTQGVCSGLVGIIAGIMILSLLKSRELGELVVTLRSKFWKAKVVVPSREDL